MVKRKKKGPVMMQDGALLNKFKTIEEQKISKIPFRDDLPQVFVASLWFFLKKKSKDLLSRRRLQLSKVAISDPIICVYWCWHILRL